MITSSTAAGSTRARETASRMVRAPSCGAVNDESPPRYRPIGVRTADTMTGVVLSGTETAPVGVTDGKITLPVGVAPVEDIELTVGVRVLEAERWSRGHTESHA